MLQNEYLVAKIGFDTEENEPSKGGGSSEEWGGCQDKATSDAKHIICERSARVSLFKLADSLIQEGEIKHEKGKLPLFVSFSIFRKWLTA